MHFIVPAGVRVGYGDVAEVYRAFFGVEGAEGDGPGGVGVDFGGVDVGDVGAAEGRGWEGGGVAGGVCCGGDEGGEEEGEEKMGGEGWWHFGGDGFLLSLAGGFLEWAVEWKGE